MAADLTGQSWKVNPRCLPGLQNTFNKEPCGQKWGAHTSWAGRSRGPAGRAVLAALPSAPGIQLHGLRSAVHPRWARQVPVKAGLPLYVGFWP